MKIVRTGDNAYHDFLGDDPPDTIRTLLHDLVCISSLRGTAMPAGITGIASHRLITRNGDRTCSGVNNI